MKIGQQSRFGLPNGDFTLLIGKKSDGNSVILPQGTIHGNGIIDIGLKMRRQSFVWQMMSKNECMRYLGRVVIGVCVTVVGVGVIVVEEVTVVGV